MSLPDSATLAQGKAWLRARMDVGANCPCCTQNVKVYKRKINSGMARSLIAIYTVGGRSWVHVPTQIGARSREEGKLAYWGLLEEDVRKREDGGRTGNWRVTAHGESFVRGQSKVPKYVNVYNGRVLGFPGAQYVDIKDALTDKFDYAELMRGV